MASDRFGNAVAIDKGRGGKSSWGKGVGGGGNGGKGSKGDGGVEFDKVGIGNGLVGKGGDGGDGVGKDGDGAGNKGDGSDGKTGVGRFGASGWQEVSRIGNKDLRRMERRIHTVAGVGRRPGGKGKGKGSGKGSACKDGGDEGSNGESGDREL